MEPNNIDSRKRRKVEHKNKLLNDRSDEESDEADRIDTVNLISPLDLPEDSESTTNGDYHLDDDEEEEEEDKEIIEEDCQTKKNSSLWSFFKTENTRHLYLHKSTQKKRFNRTIKCQIDGCRWPPFKDLVLQGSTSDIRTHLKKTHKLTDEQINNGFQKFNEKKNTDVIEGIHSSMVNKKESTLNDLLFKIILRNNLSITFVEDDDVQTILKMIGTGINGQTDKFLTSRREMVRYFQTKYDEMLSLIMETLSKIDCVSISTDTWSSTSLISYIATYVHYVDPVSFTKKKILLAFNEITGSQTGDILATYIMRIVKQFNLQTKVVGITTNGASDNKSMCNYLKDSFIDLRDLTSPQEFRDNADFSNCFFEGTIQHCSIDIVSLTVQRFLKNFDQKYTLTNNNNLSLNRDIYEAYSAIQNDAMEQKNIDMFFFEGLQKDAGLIKSIRSLLFVIKNTPTIRENYMRFCTGNNESTESIVIDCPTRWSSTFEMISFAMSHRKSLDQITLEKGRTFLHTKDWIMLRIIIIILNRFQEISTYFSNSNTYLNNSLRLYYIMLEFLRDLEESSIEVGFDDMKNMNIHEIPVEIKESAKIAADFFEFNYLTDASKSNFLYLSSILDPRTKTGMIYANSSFLDFRTVMSDLKERIDLFYSKPIEMTVDQYLQNTSSINLLSRETATIARSDQSNSGLNKFNLDLMATKSFKMKLLTDNVLNSQTGLLNLKGEFDDYLAKDVAYHTINFDLLDYWKENKAKYPHLACLARAIFSIPPTTIDCERSFSIARGVLTIRQDGLSSTALQKIMLLKCNLNILNTSEEDNDINYFVNTGNFPEYDIPNYGVEIDSEE